MPVTFRRAEASDAAAIAAQRIAYWLEQTSECPMEPNVLGRLTERVAADLEEGRAVAWIAEDAGRLLAVVWIVLVRKLPWPGDWDARWAYVTNVWTAPDARGAGLGGRLLEAVKAWAMTEHLEFLLLWPSVRSVAWYKRHGFREASDALIWDGRPQWADGQSSDDLA